MSALFSKLRGTRFWPPRRRPSIGNSNTSASSQSANGSANAQNPRIPSIPQQTSSSSSGQSTAASTSGQSNANGQFSTNQSTGTSASTAPSTVNQSGQPQSASQTTAAPQRTNRTGTQTSGLQTVLTGIIHSTTQPSTSPREAGSGRVQSTFNAMLEDPPKQDRDRFKQEITGVDLLIEEIAKRNGKQDSRRYMTLFKEKTEDGAGRTTLCIVLGDQGLRDIVYQALKRDGLLTDCPWPWTVIWDKSITNTGSSHSINAFLGCNAYLRLPNPSDVLNFHSIYGQPIEVPGRHYESTRCTLGGLVEIDGKVFGITVGHPFQEPPAQTATDDTPLVNSATLNSQEDESKHVRRRDGLRFVMPSIWSLRKRVLQENSTKTGVVKPPHLRHLGKLYDIGSSEFCDWALMEIETTTKGSLTFPKTLPKPHHAKCISVAELEEMTTDSLPPSVRVKGGFSGAHEGKLRFTPVIWSVAGKRLEVFAIFFDGPLELGDSGSLVTHDDMPCGMIIGASLESNVAFMLDISVVFEDIKIQTGSKDISIVQSEVSTQDGSSTAVPEAVASSPAPASTTPTDDPAAGIVSQLSRRSTFDPQAEDLRNLSISRTTVWPAQRGSADSSSTTSSDPQAARPSTLSSTKSLDPAEYRDRLPGIKRVNTLRGSRVHSPDNSSRSASNPSLGGSTVRNSVTSVSSAYSPAGSTITSVNGHDFNRTTSKEILLPAPMMKNIDSLSHLSAEDQLLQDIGSRVLTRLRKLDRSTFHQAGAFGDRPNGQRLREVVVFYLKTQKTKRMAAGMFIGKPKSMLCGRCAQLQLTLDDFKIYSRESKLASDQTRLRTNSSPRRNSSHGTLQSITMRAAWCPLCKIIVDSAREQVGLSWLDSSSVIEDDLNSSQRRHLNTMCSLSWQVNACKTPRIPADRLLTSSQAEDELALRQHTPPKLQPSSRCLKVSWSDPKLEPCWILPTRKKGVTNGLYGEYLNGRSTKIAAIQKWTARCLADHPECSQSFSTSEPTKPLGDNPFFSVVDLDSMSLRSLPNEEKYVALSYSWGGVGGYQNTIATAALLQKPGGIREIRSRLPKIIQDAMTFTRELGVRYLWVDALCITQDSPLSWELNASILDRIFSQSFLTLCEADRTNAKTEQLVERNGKEIVKEVMPDGLGLPEYESVIGDYSPELRLMAYYPMSHYLRGSHWFSRAWTFQENLLSHRNVIFGSDRIFWQCRRSVWREDIVDDDASTWTPEDDILPIRFHQTLASSPIQAFADVVEDYSRRSRSYIDDALNAITGVTKYIGTFLGDSDLYFALPRTHFDWALLWQRKGPIIEEERFRSDSYQRVPSWSWLSCQGSGAVYRELLAPGTSVNLHSWLQNHTWVEWFQRDRIGNLRPVWYPNTKEPIIASKWRGYELPSGEHESVKCKQRDCGFDPGHDLRPRWIKTYSECKHHLDFSLTLPEFPSPPHVDRKQHGRPTSESPARYQRDLPYLQFKTWSAAFTLLPDVRSPRTGEPLVDGTCGRNVWGIVDSCGQVRGLICPERSSLATSDEGAPIRLDAGAHRFLAISDSPGFSEDERAIVQSYGAGRADPTYDAADDDWDVYYVLLVADINGVSYRMGLGRMYKDAFSFSCENEGRATWKEVILS